ncbi:MAG: hypothetical protein NVS9B1_04900 [Candidatus Dormibacteraceae bacterium]
MKEEVRKAFEEMTQAPHPALRDQLRARLLAGPPRPTRWYPALAAIAAVVLVALALGYARLVGGGRAVPPVPAVIVSSSPAASPSPSPLPSATASPAPSPSASNASGFVCGLVHGDSAALSANVTDVRVGTAAGYDRFVIQFDGPVPSFTVAPQDTPTFTEDASGRAVTLQGTHGVSIGVAGASSAQTYSGPTDFTPGYPSLREARRTGDFERSLHWALGIGSAGCIRAFVLDSPPRLVVDVQH